MGMWMEGVGSWNGMMMEQSRETWLPHYQHYHGQFLTRWEPLINMMPVAELRAMQVGRGWWWCCQRVLLCTVKADVCAMPVMPIKWFLLGCFGRQIVAAAGAYCAEPEWWMGQHSI